MNCEIVKIQQQLFTLQFMVLQIVTRIESDSVPGTVTQFLNANFLTEQEIGEEANQMCLIKTKVASLTTVCKFSSSESSPYHFQTK